MKINRWIALAMIAVLVVGVMGIVSYRVFAQNSSQPAAQSGTEEPNDGTDVPGQDSSDEVPPAQTGITADEAQAIVEKAYPEATTIAVEFDREGGKDMWEVELDNDLDVKVDAASGEILYSEKRD